MLHTGSFSNCMAVGSLCICKTSHQLISQGRGLSRKPAGISRAETEERISEVSVLSVRWKSQDKASATQLCFPVNHCEYRQHLAFMVSLKFASHVELERLFMSFKVTVVKPPCC